MFRFCSRSIFFPDTARKSLPFFLPSPNPDPILKLVELTADHSIKFHAVSSLTSQSRKYIAGRYLSCNKNDPQIIPALKRSGVHRHFSAKFCGGYCDNLFMIRLFGKTSGYDLKHPAENVHPSCKKTSGQDREYYL